MPRYTYECTKCSFSYEKTEGWDAKPRQRCPECRAVSQRIPTPPMIVFKGSGFYSTDNKRSFRSDSAGSSEGSSSSNEVSENDSESTKSHNEEKQRETTDNLRKRKPDASQASPHTKGSEDTSEI